MRLSKLSLFNLLFILFVSAASLSVEAAGTSFIFRLHPGGAPGESAPPRLESELGLELRSPPLKSLDGPGDAVAFEFAGPDDRIEISGRPLDQWSRQFSLCFWMRIDRFPATGDWQKGMLVWKGDNQGYQLSFLENGTLFPHGFGGDRWIHGPGRQVMKRGEWQHVALIVGDSGTSVYLDGQRRWHYDWAPGLMPVSAPLVIGGTDWQGAVAAVRMYGVELAADGVQADLQDRLAARPATADEQPEVQLPMQLHLTRFDLPRPDRSLTGNVTAVTRHEAARRDGPNAVDWPRITLDGRPVFESGPRERIMLPLRDPGRDRAAMSWLREDHEVVIQPGDHWLRQVQWRWGQVHVYTTDRTAHGFGQSYELWTFPVQIKGEAEGSVRRVQVAGGGAADTIYDRQFEPPLDSLILLLPASAPGQPYRFTINQVEAAAAADIGLLPVTAGVPREQRIPFETTVATPTGEVVLRNLPRPERFVDQAAWDEDLERMAVGPLPALMPEEAAAAAVKEEAVVERGPLSRHLGIAVARSPIAVNGVSLGYGMSSGWFFESHHNPRFPGSVDEFARFVRREVGLDRVFGKVRENHLRSPGGEQSHLRWLQALAREGVQGGVWVDTASHSSLAMDASFLPEYNRRLIRDVQLTAQYLGRMENFVGVMSGTDNAGYVPFWDWAPPIMNRPWARAFTQFQRGQPGSTAHRPAAVPTGPGVRPRHSYEGNGSQAEFMEYVRRFDDLFQRYGDLGQAVLNVNPYLVYTTGSYGSSPGVFGRGGWAAGSMPGRTMHERVPVLQSYDWNESSGSKPLHNVALIDRLRSYYPDKPAWVLIDDFGLHLGREARQREFALALTRGIQAVGTTWLPHSRMRQYREGLPGELREVHDWARTYGGVYTMTEPMPTVGVLYVHEQAVSRHADAEDPHGPHEGKTLEAFLLCHLAGYPAKIVTPEEIARGLPASMQALLLVGLNRFDDTWAWWEAGDGLEEQLREFVDNGGRIILDHESVSPVEAMASGLEIAAFYGAGVGRRTPGDMTPQIFERNRENLEVLRRNLAGVERPVAASDDPTVWAVPHVSGDVQYLTVVNRGWVEGENPSRVVKPQTASLDWHTDRPIYQVRERRQLSREEARQVDLTAHGFQLYAMPPRPVATLRLAAALQDDGFYAAQVEVNAMVGIPIAVTVLGAGDQAVVFGATGQPLRLPLAADSPAGVYQVEAVELLAGLATSIEVAHEPVQRAPAGDALLPDRLAAFARRSEPLVVALTPEQQEQPEYRRVSQALVEHYRELGRHVSLETVEPLGVVPHRQPYRSVAPFPRWSTVAADVILFGSPRNNLLLFDQWRGGLLPAAAADLTGQEEGLIAYSLSPFVGGFDAVNLILEQDQSIEPLLGRLRRLSR